MTRNATTTKSHVIGLEGLDAHREIKRIAEGVVHRRIASEVLLTEECREVAESYYVEIIEVYRKVWQKVSTNPDLHRTHPAGKTQAYHFLRERAER